MKATIVFLTLVFLSTYTYAESAVIACDILTFSTDKKTCYEKLGKSYISPNAISTCKKASFGKDKIDCLYSSKDKYISKKEAEICGKESFGGEIATCMKNAGGTQPINKPIITDRPRRAPIGHLSDTERFNKIRKLARTITLQINNSEYTSAKANLNLIQELTEGRREKVNIPDWTKKLNKIQIPN